MKYYKTIIYIQLIVIIGLLCVIFVVLNQQSHKEKIDPNNSIIKNFDQGDFDRIDEMVKRFNKRIGDNLMLISPTIEGGSWIHDVFSNGYEITWIVDNTRDGMSANTGKTEYHCQSIEINERDEHFVVELSRCTNYKEDEKLGLVAFRKEKL
jgi:hypothetical protein